MTSQIAVWRCSFCCLITKTFRVDFLAGTAPFCEETSRSLHVCCSQGSGFLSEFKDMQGVLIGASKLLAGVYHCDKVATCPGCTTPVKPYLQQDTFFNKTMTLF